MGTIHLSGTSLSLLIETNTGTLVWYSKEQLSPPRSPKLHINREKGTEISKAWIPQRTATGTELT